MELVPEEAARVDPQKRAAIFALAAGQPRDLLDSVRRRLLLVALLAIAPVATLSMVQGLMHLSGAQDEARQRLLQLAVSAASSQANIIASAESVLQTLQTVEGVRSAGPACQATLYGATLSLPFVSNMGVIDREGTVVCSAIAGPRSVAGEAWWRSLSTGPMRLTLSDRMVSPATRTQIIAVLEPLRTPDGRFDGAMALGLDAARLDTMLRQATLEPGGVAAIFDASGRELVSNARALSADLFDPRRIAGSGSELREVVDPSGRSWTYTVAPLDRQGLVAAYALPTQDLFGWTPLAVAASFALPGLVAVLSLVGLWFAVDRMVLRWLHYLRRVASVYAQGHYGFRPTRLETAPSEFRVLGAAVENMALAVRLRDAKLRENLAEKTALVREIHHRIKNSLQVVVSLLSLYGLGIGHGEDRRRFEELRTRVNTLAVVHRILHEASEGSAVKLRELLRELAALLEGVPDRNLAVRINAPDLLLPVDMAVPFALMVVEIVHGLAIPDAPRLLPVTVGCEQGDGRLSICIAAGPAARTGATYGRFDLDQGFANQLGGQLTRTEEGDNVRVTGDFPLRTGAAPGAPRQGQA
ncbi:sensor histidine kinase [Xanthobacter sp. KR7-225]|uniref:sensor histidine kinase n=1 Tax=Xanthobacter sp. KR7-225 TaxID=3156613 RepID=UPI0032B33112